MNTLPVQHRWSYLWAFVPPALIPLSVALAKGAPSTGNYWLLLPAFCLFVLLPALDFRLGIDTHNPPPGTPSDDVVLRVLPLLALPWVIYNLWLTLQVVTSASWISPLGVTVLVGATGIINATLGITAAHELIHKNGVLQRFTGGTLLALVCYASFKVEHIRGHHAWVATPRDPSSAPLGQSLYAFLPRAVGRNIINGWKLEARRLRRAGRSLLSWRNELLYWSGLSLLFALLCGHFYGWPGVAVFLAQALVAILTLETINYIEHYGLRRRRLANGRYEAPSICHSWNSSFFLSNRMLFQLQRHSDHHAAPKRPYQRLRHHPQSPQLPAGYASMFLIAFLPPLFRRIIHPRLIEPSLHSH